MKIGIMGGTFNPIHNGHLMLGEYAYRNFELDEIWFMPNGNPPHKSNPNLLDNTRYRREMVELAIKEIPYFRLCDYELERKETSYSYETMEYFKQRYPDDQFYFIVGADSLFSLEKWKHPERLLKVVTLLAAYRDDADTPEEMYRQIDDLNSKFGSDIRLLQTPLVQISSNEIRTKLAKRNSYSAEELMIPKSVADYIDAHGLYQEE